MLFRSGTTLANAQYLGVENSVYGKFSNIKFSNVTYGATTAGSATVTATLNGVEFTGNIAGNATTATIGHGNTYMKLTFTNAANFASENTTENTRQLAMDDYKNTTIARVGSISGVDFAGTALAGATGSTTVGLATARLTGNGPVDISNFTYEGGISNASVLSVMVNGQRFVATTVLDNITAGGTLVFSDDAKLQAIRLDFTGLDTAITNIHDNLTDRANFINALNTGFSRAGAGLSFAVGSQATDSIRVALGSVTSASVFNGAQLDVTSATNAQAASTVLDAAITKVTSVRASVGALQSRFNFASNAIQSSIENQDAARGSILDTDVSAESTAYATAQVQLQAGISVLAQANQLQQNLLKLIQ